MMESDQTDADRKLKLVLENLASGCTKYLSVSKGSGSGPGTGKTRLDRERMKMCQKEIVSNFGNCFTQTKFISATFTIFTHATLLVGFDGKKRSKFKSNRYQALVKRKIQDGAELLTEIKELSR